MVKQEHSRQQSEGQQSARSSRKQQHYVMTVGIAGFYFRIPYTILGSILQPNFNFWSSLGRVDGFDKLETVGCSLGCDMRELVVSSNNR